MKVAYGSFRDRQYAMRRASAFGKPSCLMLGDVRNHVACDMQSRIFGVNIVCFALQVSQIKRVRQFLRVLSAVCREGSALCACLLASFGVPWSASGPALELSRKRLGCYRRFP